MLFRRSLFGLVMCALLTMSSVGASEILPGISDPGMATRAKLKEKYLLQYFTLGINAPVEWVVETREKNGAKWDFRMQYWSGGAGWDGKDQAGIRCFYISGTSM